MKYFLGKDDKGKPRPYSLGHFFMAINIESFIGIDAFKKTTGDILRDLRNSKKMKGAERIYTAGEKEYIVKVEREKLGIPINAAMKKEML